MFWGALATSSPRSRTGLAVLSNQGYIRRDWASQRLESSQDSQSSSPPIASSGYGACQSSRTSARSLEGAGGSCVWCVLGRRIVLPFPCDVLCKMSPIYTGSPSRAPSLDILMSGFSSSSAAGGFRCENIIRMETAREYRFRRQGSRLSLVPIGWWRRYIRTPAAP